MTEDELVEWHHLFNGYELEQTPRDGEGQGSLACCSPWGHKESDTSWQLNKNNFFLLNTSHSFKFEMNGRLACAQFKSFVLFRIKFQTILTQSLPKEFNYFLLHISY